MNIRSLIESVYHIGSLEIMNIKYHVQYFLITKVNAEKLTKFAKSECLHVLIIMMYCMKGNFQKD